ncbi:hypothetical protein NSS79_20465 [Paenibacillus sp. FSL L8-0436]|uniref:hypothetical protein n=1 Tax=Paenibacillus sp. FSL L8-0436 TaxID=2954686 RepID=UPI0031588701
MRFTPKEKLAIQLALEQRVFNLERNVADWEGEDVAEDCKDLLVEAKSALKKIKEG